MNWGVTRTQNAGRVYGVRVMRTSLMGALLLCGLPVGSGVAQEAVGTATRLPVPRFVSLKPSDTPMREGPSKDHRIKWVFKKEGVPDEIIAEF